MTRSEWLQSLGVGSLVDAHCLISWWEDADEDSGLPPTFAVERATVVTTFPTTFRVQTRAGWVWLSRENGRSADGDTIVTDPAEAP